MDPELLPDDVYSDCYCECGAWTNGDKACPACKDLYNPMINEY